MQVVEIAEVSGCNEGRHIISGFNGQEFLDLPKIAASGAFNSRIDTSGATVVRSQCKSPVVEHFIQVAQVTGSGIGAFYRIAAVFDGAVGMEPVLAASGRHELPEARCSNARYGLGIEG